MESPPRRSLSSLHGVACRKNSYQTTGSRLSEDHLAAYTESPPARTATRLQEVVSQKNASQNKRRRPPESHLPNYLNSSPRRTPTRIRNVISRKTMFLIFTTSGISSLMYTSSCFALFFRPQQQNCLLPLVAGPEKWCGECNPRVTDCKTYDPDE